MHRFQCPPPTKADPTDPVTGPVSVPTAEQIKVDAPSDKNGRKITRSKNPSSRGCVLVGFSGALPTYPTLGNMCHFVKLTFLEYRHCFISTPIVPETADSSYCNVRVLAEPSRTITDPPLSRLCANSWMSGSKWN